MAAMAMASSQSAGTAVGGWTSPFAHLHCDFRSEELQYSGVRFLLAQQQLKPFLAFSSSLCARGGVVSGCYCTEWAGRTTGSVRAHVLLGGLLCS